VFEEVAEPHRTEVDVEEATVNLLEADVVPRQEGGDEDAVGVPANPAVTRDETGLEMARVGDGLKDRWEGAG
jgi:hypothetical protein